MYKCYLFCFPFLAIPHILFAFLNVIEYYTVFIELFVTAQRCSCMAARVGVSLLK